MHIEQKLSRFLSEMVLAPSLGLKKSGGQAVIAGNIIIRQRGTKYHPGDNVGLGKDHTIFALTEGKVSFKKSGDKTIVSVVTE